MQFTCIIFSRHLLALHVRYMLLTVNDGPHKQHCGVCVFIQFKAAATTKKMRQEEGMKKTMTKLQQSTCFFFFFEINVY